MNKAKALEHVAAARRKGSKSACRIEAENAAREVGIGIADIPLLPNRPGQKYWPDLDKLEEMIRAA